MSFDIVKNVHTALVSQHGSEDYRTRFYMEPHRSAIAMAEDATELTHSYFRAYAAVVWWDLVLTDMAADLGNSDQFRFVEKLCAQCARLDGSLDPACLALLHDIMVILAMDMVSDTAPLAALLPS